MHKKERERAEKENVCIIKRVRGTGWRKKGEKKREKEREAYRE